ncbi:unnamed protein product [Bemisia tabaci]|uniref:Uncharacterized protein n=1 Tax=Bemisia tabaci TaxID=7038 RepID=A0A9P0AM98_BEMTA|nr:unnamed protein product [Bemisia tabaci]
MSKQRKYLELLEQDKLAKEEIRRGKTFEEFRRITENKHFLYQVKQSADQKSALIRRKLEIRRNKLRKLLTEDARNFSEEYRRVSTYATNKKLEIMEKKARALKLNRLREEEAFANEKILQKIKDNSEEVRTVMTKQTLLHTKEAQLKQIEDRQRRKKEEEQLESMWNEYSRNIKTLEQQCIEGKRSNNKQTKEMIRKQLLRQIEMKKQILDQEQWIKELEREECKKAREEEENERQRAHQEKLRKMYQLKETYEELLKKKHEMEESRQRELLELQKRQNKEIEEELKREMEEKIKHKMQMKLETELFLKYLENVRKERQNLDYLYEQSKSKEEQQLTKKQEEEKRRFEEARIKLNKKVLEVREKQIEDVRRNKIQQRELQLMERDMLQAEQQRLRQLEVEETRRHKERAARYYMDITRQVEEKRRLEEQEKLLSIGAYEKERKEEEALRKTVQELLNEPGRLIRV